MRGPILDEVVFVSVKLKITVEVFVSQEVLGSIRTSFKEILSSVGKSQMMLAYILQYTLPSKIPSSFICGTNIKRTGLAVHKASTFTSFLFIAVVRPRLTFFGLR